MVSVLGDNVKQARLSTPQGQHLNEKGELTDRWGTPYLFHQLSKTQMEIRSRPGRGDVDRGRQAVKIAGNRRVRNLQLRLANKCLISAFSSSSLVTVSATSERTISR
jgi:hypothetical protein